MKKNTKTAKKLVVKKASEKEKILIKKEMAIGEATEKFPETAMVMMKYGLHCVGCHVASWESIEEGAQGHGFDEKKIKTLIDEMNKVANMAKTKK